MTSQPSQLDSAVRSKFTVKDTFQLPEGDAEYSVEYLPDSKVSFELLNKELSKKGFTPRLIGTKAEAILFIRKSQAPAPRRSRIPVILGLLTLASVVVFGLFERVIYEQFAPRFQGNTVLFAYGATVVVIVGLHELGHRYLARRSGELPPTSYLIPGIPDVTAFLPALGIVARQKSPAVNRDRFFDIMIVGPMLGLAAAVVLYSVGALLSVQSSVPLLRCQDVNSYISVCPTNPSIIQATLDYVLGPFMPGVASGFVRLSPLQDGATVGFILTFIGLLPMASLDGGHLSRLAWGSRASRVATYLSVFALISLDIPNYWALAIVVLLVAGRPAEPQVLDEVTGISGSRRWLYLGALVLALLSLPIPQNFATFPLG